MNFLEYKLTLKLPNKLPEKSIVANTINPHSYCVAKTDEIFHDALISSDILIPDGIGVVWASKVLYRKNIFKISGYDLHMHFLNLLQNGGGGRVFYFGSSDHTLALICERIGVEFPLIEVEVFSPPFKEDFDPYDNDFFVNKINEFSPDLLFVGMTAPKQEKWVYYNKNRLSAKVICSIGAVFDFYAGTVKRPNQFWIRLGLEWLPRFIKEPLRLWRRNLVSTPKFIFEVLKFKLFL